MISEAYIGLGSNLGDCARNLRAALDMMRPFALEVYPSPLYRTAPQGFSNQPAFYNAVCRIRTRLDPFQLMERLLIIEKEIGRRRTFRNAPRMLDLDILMYDRLVFDTPPLALPHPRMSARLFVLRPLADIAPLLKHPVSGKTTIEMLKCLPAQSDSMLQARWQ